MSASDMAGERLSITDAAKLLSHGAPAAAEPNPPPAPVEAAQSAPEPQETPIQADPTAELDLTEETPGEVAATIEPVSPAVDPPHYWDASQKEAFAQLSPELQRVAVDQWKNGERVINKAQQEAAEARKVAENATKQAEAKAAEATQFVEKLNAIVPKAEEVFADRWSKVNWVELATVQPDEYVKYRAIHDAEQMQLQQLQAARKEASEKAESQRVEAEKTARQQRATEQGQLLRNLVPDLADAKEGPARLKRLGDYMLAQAITPDQIANAGAREISLAYKAMLFDEARARAAAKAPKPAPTPAKPAVKPGGANPTPTKPAPAQAMERLSKTGSRNDAMAALKAQRIAQRG